MRDVGKLKARGAPAPAEVAGGYDGAHLLVQPT